MRRTSSRHAPRPIMIHLLHINRISVRFSFSRTSCLPRRYSKLCAPITHAVDVREPQPAISLASDDSKSASSGYNALCTNLYTGLNPHKYTKGRWLRRDKLERDSRILNFDFEALRKRVIQLCPGATAITRYEKEEGGCNRIFIFTCDNARRVVARLPTSVAGPARLTTNSEVATITYSELNTSFRATHSN